MASAHIVGERKDQQQRRSEQSAISIVYRNEPRMNSLQRNLFALSRVLVPVIFLLNGLGVVSQAQAVRDLLSHGTPASLVPFLMLSARTLEVVAGFCFAFGIYPREAALELLVFMVPSTFVAHDFWKAAGTAAYTPQLLNFLKNTAIVGGLLFIVATPSQPTLLERSSRLNGPK